MPFSLPRRLLATAALSAGCRVSRSRCVQLARPPRDVGAVAQSRFVRLIEHARQNVPFYRDRLQRCDQDVDPMQYLASLPVLRKDDVEAHFPDGITDGSDSSKWRLLSTRGTAQRLITVQAFAKRDAVRAAQIRSLRLSGNYGPGMGMVEIPPEVCETVCGELGEVEAGVLSHAWQMLRKGDLRDPKSFRDLRGLVERHWILNRRMYSGFGRYGSHPPDEVLKGYVDQLRRDRPYLLKALATYLTSIARYIQRNRITSLSIPVIKTMGSRVTPGQRQLLERAFGGTYWDDYGSAEFGSIACECRMHRGLHVFDDFFIVEVVDASGSRVADGQRGWILVTDLLNDAMPLIRYKIGDVGVMDSSDCPCGQASPRLTVLGRAHDVIVDSENKWRTTDDVVDFLEALPGIETGQITCRGANRYDVALVLASGDQAAIDLQEAKRRIEVWLGPAAVADVHTATTLRPEAGGKFRYVRGNLEDR